MKAQHTPGPWVADGKEVFSTVGGRRRIAQVWNFDVGQETADANARLIAAAPEILEAAVAALELLKVIHDETGKVGMQLQAAIAKATWGEV